VYSTFLASDAVWARPDTAGFGATAEVEFLETAAAAGAGVAAGAGAAAGAGVALAATGA